MVSWADTCSDSTIRFAITLRSRVIFSVLPRSGLGETGADLSAAGCCAAGGACEAAGAAGSSGFAFAAAAASSTSCLRIRPPTPLPSSEVRSTPCSAAILRTSGVT